MTDEASEGFLKAWVLGGPRERELPFIAMMVIRLRIQDASTCDSGPGGSRPQTLNESSPNSRNLEVMGVAELIEDPTIPPTLISVETEELEIATVFFRENVADKPRRQAEERLSRSQRAWGAD